MKGGWSSIRAAVVVLAVAIAGFGAVTAVAQTKFSTGLTLKLKRTTDKDTIKGTVSSKARACERNRKVKLRHRPVSELEQASIIATIRTNGKGKWKFTPKKNTNGFRFAKPGNYKVKAGEVKLPGDDGGITCKEKISSSVFIG